MTLVRARERSDNVEPTEERTGIWVRPPHKADGTVTYTRRRSSSWRTWTAPTTAGSQISCGPSPDEGRFVGATGAGRTTITRPDQPHDIADGKIHADGA